MKRNKFIKLLMANGYQRNQAAKMANEVRNRYGTSYKEIWENPMFRIGVYAQRACKTFAALGIAAIAAANALDTAFRENNGL